MAEYVEAIGRRKTSTARVRLYPGTGEIVVNDKPMAEYFGRDLDRMILRQPLSLTGTEATYNISVHVNDGAPGHLARLEQDRRQYASCAQGRRFPDPRCAGQGTQEARSQARP